MGLAVALAMLVGVIASPASATKPEPDSDLVSGDYALEDPEDECTLDVPPPPPPPEEPGECPDGSEADSVVTFPGNKLVPRIPTQTVNIDIPAGEYDVTLIAGDYNRGGSLERGPLVRPHERWRLLGSTPTGYTDDLVDGIANISGVATSGLTVVFDSGVSSVTAEHYSVGTGDDGTNSVVPEYACLTESD